MAQTQQVRGVATSIRTEYGITYVRYHNTDVVEFSAEYARLKTGGWYTVTTKARMNQASNQFDLGYHVYQQDHAWYVIMPNKKTVVFKEGMKFDRMSS